MDIYSLQGKKEIIKSFSPRTRVIKNCTLAFLFGGLICLIAEALRSIYTSAGVPKDDVLTLVGATLIVAAAILTALGIFDSIARYAGAGTLVPITGFSNAVTSQALDARSEGMILGVGSKIFTVAGPVILYGISSGAVYGILLYILIYIM